MAYAQLNRDLRRAYDAMAEVRDAMDDEAWKQAERARFRDLLRAAGATSLLEIGAGHGVSGRFFADAGFEVVCVDLSPELVARCRAKGLAAHVMDFGALEFPAASFHAGFGMQSSRFGSQATPNCLLHVPRANLGRVLRSIRRVLAPGGLFYWGQYGGHDFEGVYPEDTYEPKRFFSRMTDERIQRAASKAFEIVDFRSVPRDKGWSYQALVLRRNSGGTRAGEPSLEG
jgi:SAM-dependent methyltransferase